MSSHLIGMYIKGWEILPSNKIEKKNRRNSRGGQVSLKLNRRKSFPLRQFISILLTQPRSPCKGAIHQYVNVNTISETLIISSRSFLILTHLSNFTNHDIRKPNHSLLSGFPTRPKSFVSMAKPNSQPSIKLKRLSLPENRPTPIFKLLTE